MLRESCASAMRVLCECCVSDEALCDLLRSALVRVRALLTLWISFPWSRKACSWSLQQPSVNTFKRCASAVRVLCGCCVSAVLVLCECCAIAVRVVCECCPSAVRVLPPRPPVRLYTVCAFLPCDTAKHVLIDRWRFLHRGCNTSVALYCNTCRRWFLH
jgi:hypothetical protein